MIIGLIVSTEIEINAIIQTLKNCKRSNIHYKTFYQGITNSGLSIVVCICGVGKVNAAYGTTLLLERFHPDIIYVIGVGGAYPSSGLNIGDIAIAEKEIYGDEGLALKKSFHTMEEINLPLLRIKESSYFNEFSMCIPNHLKEFKNKGNFITVSSCTGCLEKSLQIEQRFGAVCENMEGAAVAHICTFYRMPVVEIRGISNIIEDRKVEPLNKQDIIKASDNVQRFFISKLSDSFSNFL